MTIVKICWSLTAVIIFGGAHWKRVFIGRGARWRGVLVGEGCSLERGARWRGMLIRNNTVKSFSVMFFSQYFHCLHSTSNQIVMTCIVQ